jgi:hypothetical protein
MSVKTETREIEGLTVMSTQLPAMRAYSVFAGLLKIAGPALSGISNVQNIGDLDISALCTGVAENTGLALELLASTEVILDGRKVSLATEDGVNLVFSGRLMTMLQTLKFALEVNFRDFLSDKLVDLVNSGDEQSRQSEVRE